MARESVARDLAPRAAVSGNLDPRSVLAADRAAVLNRIQAMTGEFDEMVAASADANIDDEHDPEGATIAFERAQVSALLDQARRLLADIDVARAKLDQGGYGVCERCGLRISPARLVARPAARMCITCASS
jgi:DnaK suppressor protein